MQSKSQQGQQQQGAGAGAAGSLAVPRRLFNLRDAGEYVNCSWKTVQDWVLAGFIPTVELPPLRQREGDPPRKSLRRVLIDREDLDAFIESRKQPGAVDVQSRERANAPINTGRNRGRVPAVCPEP